MILGQRNSNALEEEGAMIQPPTLTPPRVVRRFELPYAQYFSARAASGFRAVVLPLLKIQFSKRVWNILLKRANGLNKGHPKIPGPNPQNP